jgi:hypothetical protein
MASPFSGQLAARDGLLDQALGVALALVGGFLRLVDQHRFDAGHGLDIGDARTHHAGAQDGHLLDVVVRHAGRTARALAQFLQGQEQGADHALGLGRHHRLEEVAGLDPQGGVERNLQALIDGLHDVQLGGIVAVGALAQHGVAHDEHLAAARGVGAAAGELELLLVPRRDRVALGLDPGLGGLDLLAGRHDFMHDLVGQGLGRLHRLAFQQVRRGGHHAHQARQALGAAGARQQADLGFRQGQLDLRVVGHHAIVAGQGDLEPAAHGQAVDGRGHRLAAGFQGAERLVQRKAGFEGGLQAFFARTRAGQTAGAAQFTQVSAGAEAGRLARGDHRALDGGVRLDGFHHLADFLDDRGGQGVHRPAGHVEGDQGHAVGIDLDLEVFHGVSSLDP